MPAEQPEPSYIPRARVRLAIRFEEFSRNAGTPKPPKKPPHLRTGTGVDNKGNLSVSTMNGAFILQAPDEHGPTLGTPQQQGTSKDGLTYVLEGIIPIRMNVLRNGIRMADTCSLELDFLDFPFYPPIVRSIAIECYLGCLSDADFQKETQGRQGSAQGQHPMSMIPDTYVDAYGRQRTNRRFSGYVDQILTKHGKLAASTVLLECTDNTRLLIGQDAPPKLVIAADKPLDRAVADYLANFPQYRGLRIEYRPAGATPPTLSKALAKSAFKPKLGPPPAGGAGAGGGGTSKLSVWDYLTDIAVSLGLIVRFEDATIIFQRPRTLYASKFSGRADDAFTGRILPGGRVIKNRLFVHGANIDDLEFGRKFNRFQSANVEVRCYSAALGKTLVARFPTKEDRQKQLLPGDAADEKWTVYTLHGIEDLETMRSVAQSIYEVAGRNEFSTKFATNSLGSFGGSNLDPDALDVQAGDTIDVEVRREVGGGFSAGEAEESIAVRASTWLKSLGYDPALADAYQAAMTQVGFPTTFRVGTVAINWDNDQGVSFDFDCINYLEVRASKNLPAGEEIEPSADTVKPVRVQVEDGATDDKVPFI